MEHVRTVDENKIHIHETRVPSRNRSTCRPDGYIYTRVPSWNRSMYRPDPYVRSLYHTGQCGPVARSSSPAFEPCTQLPAGRQSPHARTETDSATQGLAPRCIYGLFSVPVSGRTPTTCQVGWSVMLSSAQLRHSCMHACKRYSPRSRRRQRPCRSLACMPLYLPVQDGAQAPGRHGHGPVPAHA
jgi:hypothetical protein